MKRIVGIALCCASMAAVAMGQPVTFTTLAGSNGGWGSADGQGSAARFNGSQGIAGDAAGNLYVTDTGNNTIRKMTAAGEVTTLAGLAGSSGSTDGQGSAARFSAPQGIAADAAGNLYVTDTANHTIRKMTPTGDVTTLAGLAGIDGSADGQGSAARFFYPEGIAADAAGNLYVTDTVNHTIRKMTPTGDVTTLAGLAGIDGSADGQGSAARFFYPGGIAADAAGNLYVTDSGNNTIRKVTAAGEVTTLAGLAGSSGSGDGQGSAARFFNPRRIAASAGGNLYVTDTGNNTIRKMTAAGEVTTLAGLAGSPGSADGQGSAARFLHPEGIGADAAGVIYVTDTSNNTIRKVTLAGDVTTIAGLPGSPGGSTDGQGRAARFYSPHDIALGSAGNLYVTDTGNNTIRKMTAAGEVTTLAGLAGSSGSTDGQGSAARFNDPGGIAADAAGNLYVTDSGNNTIRKVTAAGEVTTLAGLAGSSGSGDGQGSAARFFNPRRIAASAGGHLYVTDLQNHTIRKVTAAGNVTTLAGLAGSSGSADGRGSAAQFSYPAGIAADAAGNLYVSDSGNNTIRKVTAAGDVTTLAGLAGNSGSADGQGSAARFYQPAGIAVDTAGNLYVADTYNHTIRKVTAGGDVTTLAGLAGPWGNAEGTGVLARFYFPLGIAVDPSGVIYVTDTSNNRVQVGRPGLADSATIDSASGEVGLRRALDVLPRTATSWEWTMIRRPSASSAMISSTTVPNPSFTPDIADLYEFRAVASDGASSSITTVSLLAFGSGNTGCTAGETVLCLNNGRFRVSANWQSPANSGVGTATSLTPDTGYFWFFDSANVEMVVKVLDGCGINNRYWVFAAGLTNVGVNLTVQDTQTGTVRTYTNPINTPFQPIQDTAAFATCP